MGNDQAGQGAGPDLAGSGKLQILAYIPEKTSYSAALPWFEIVEKAIAEKAPSALAKYLK